MFNSLPIQLRHEQIYLKELQIGQIIEMAKIPQELNELRMNSFLAYTCQDDSIAMRLTVQERYYILLNYLAISNNDYMINTDVSEFFIKAKTAPDMASVNGVYVSQLLGSHAILLQSKCENIYEWLAGKIACQLSGDLTHFFGDEQNPVIWEHLPTDNQDTLENVFRSRFEMINRLTDSLFSQLTDIYYQGCEKLRHLVDISVDNDGITLLGNSQNQGGGDIHIARFRPTTALSDISKRLSQLIAE
ncbi:hypothetical protein [Faucicola boevrei]|uniref:hypothetical protein n=1 Tax=Faucicola boevrei TaxID=346665 RepID=UPI00037576C7|nr:hypothetical protein [Moraxella boevrei]